MWFNGFLLTLIARIAPFLTLNLGLSPILLSLLLAQEDGYAFLWTKDSGCNRDNSHILDSGGHAFVLYVSKRART